MESDITKIVEINCNEILPNRFQPRIINDESDLLELSDSIKKYGLIQPIIVRKIGKKFEIIIGERRYKACILAGLDKIPAIIKDVNDRDCFELSVVENVQRKNLSPIEEALSYQKAIIGSSSSLSEFSKNVGKREELINNKIKLLSLSDNVQEALINNEISERHARSLLKIDNYSEQNFLLKRIINERLTVKRTDEEIEKIKNNKQKILNKENKEEESNMNNDANFMFNTSEQPQTFNIFETNSKEGQVSNNIFSTEPASPSFINNNTPMHTQVPNSENSTMPVTDNQKEPMFVLFDEENNNTPSIQENVEIESVAEPKEDSNIEKIESTINVDPIKESNTFGFNDSGNVSNITISANNPEKSPIIISDYEKQFDPVIPQIQEVQKPKVDMRSIINMIRNCQKEIENAGYIVELDEYDLADSYQVTFKIEKR